MRASRLIEADLLRRVGEPPAYEDISQGYLYMEAFHHAQRLLG
jgi:hypothetical protein